MGSRMARIRLALEIYGYRHAALDGLGASAALQQNEILYSDGAQGARACTRIFTRKAL